MSLVGRGYEALRNNWRIVLLVVLVLLSTYFIFVPGAPIGGDTGGGEESELGSLTNLQFGIDLAGGSRVTAPVHGVYVDQVAFESSEHATQVNDQVEDYLNVSEIDIRTDVGAGTLEIFDPNVTAAELTEALLAANLTEDDFNGPHQGVTDRTRSDIVSVLSNRLDATGFAGSSVTEQTVSGDQTFITAEWPGTRAELEAAMSDRGAVQVIAHYPTEDSWAEMSVLDGQTDIDTISSVRQSDSGGWEAPVTVTNAHAPTFVDRLQEAGFDQQEAWGTGACDFPNEDPTQERPENGWGYCLMIVQDGEVLSGYPVNPNLGQEFVGDDPSFVDSPTFTISVTERSDAEEVRFNLQEGALAAQINLDDATSMDVSPALAERFLQNSLLTGLIAIIAVVMVVFLRYGDPRIAAPMSVTALSELYLLLGFAASIGMSLDLAVMAGFIAVVGTGVDDLIIIADEVLGEHDVRSQRVFDSRFRKAFWVIGAAAATTIVAMAPLAAMQLGDLRGFAIITILGVLIGVFLTRPAYGNILRLIKTDT